MASFVDPATGHVTADPVVHGFRWVAPGDPLVTELITIWQKWIETTLATNGLTLLNYTDCVVLYAEILLVAPSAEFSSIIAAAPSPTAVFRGLLAALGENKPEPMNRAQGAKYLAHKKRSFTGAQTLACTLNASDLILRQDTYVPEWQARITYYDTNTAGGGLTLGWVWFYDPLAMRNGTLASGLLNSVRRLAEGAFRLPRNTAVPRPAPTPPAPIVPATELSPQQQQAHDAAMQVHLLTPQTDSIPPPDAAHCILSLVAANPYQASAQLRVDHPEGPARQSAGAEEIGALTTGISGKSVGYRSRLRGAISAANNPGDPNPLSEFLGDEVNSTGVLLGTLKDMAQSLLPASMQVEELLFTLQGIRALGHALKPHAAYFEHVRSMAKTAGDAPPAIDEMLELLAMQCQSANFGLGGTTALAIGTGQANLAGGPTRTANANAAMIAVASEKQNAQVFIWVANLCEDPNTTSIQVHRALFICANEAHPDWKTAGVLHAAAWGNVNATLINYKLALVYEYSTDHYIGIYLCHMLVAAAVRSKLLTAAQALDLVGFSLTALAKAARQDDWKPLDIVNDADHTIRSELARLQRRPAPPRTAAAHLLTDAAEITRATVYFKAFMEALGLQRDGENSVASLMTEHSAAATANTTMSTTAMVTVLTSNATLYKAAIAATGLHYGGCRTAINVRAEIPTCNYRNSDMAGPIREHAKIMDMLVQAEHVATTKRFCEDFFDDKPLLAGQTNASAASALIRSSAGGGGGGGGGGGSGAVKTKAERKAEDLARKKAKTEADKAANGGKPTDHSDASKAERQAKRDSAREKNVASFDAATGCVIEGPPSGPQTMSFGIRKFNLTKAKEVWPGKCYPSMFAASCGWDEESSLRYARVACPLTDAEHPDGCNAHKLDDGTPLPNSLRIGTRSSGGGRGGGRGGADKGKGKGKNNGRGKGKGRGK